MRLKHVLPLVRALSLQRGESDNICVVAEQRQKQRDNLI
jgi:hypothetical protein